MSKMLPSLVWPSRPITGACVESNICSLYFRYIASIFLTTHASVGQYQIILSISFLLPLFIWQLSHNCIIFLSEMTKIRYGFLFRSEFFFRTTQDLEYFFLSLEAQIFFPEFNIRLYDKSSESDFFFPPPESEYFFQQHWESEYFFRKKA